jgi:LysR family transcriptional regulator, cyn operon transcriptional activator
MMDFKQLEAFVVLSEELHFTRAAERLGIAQPTLSLQIRALEESVDLLLFDRVGKRITLTQAGVVLLRRAKEVISLVTNAKTELNDLRHLRTGQLVIGMLSGDLDYRLSHLMIEFHREFPQIKISLHGPVDIHQMIQQNQADIGLTVMTGGDDKIVQIPLIHETFGLLVHADHPLAESPNVEFHRLQDWPVVSFPPGYSGRELIDLYCLRQGFRVHPIIETSTVPSIVNLVQNGVGVAALSRQLVESIDANDVRFVPFVDPIPVRDIGIIYRSDKYLSHASRAFIQKLTSHLGTTRSSSDH